MHAVDLERAVFALHRDATPGMDFAIESDEDGSNARIVRWNVETLGPMPDDTEVQRGFVLALKERRKGEFVEEALSRVDGVLVIEGQGTNEAIMHMASALKEIREALGLSEVPQIDKIAVAGAAVMGAVSELESIDEEDPEASNRIRNVEMAPEGRQ